MTRKKLLLKALAIAAMKASTAAPHIELKSQRRFKRMIWKKSGRQGMLMTAKLSTEGASQVRQALEALPGSLYTPDDSKAIIIETGASCTATGDKNDLIPSTVKPLEKPFPLSGIGGTLYATHTGTCRFEALADDSSIVALEMQAYYTPGLTATLFSPQAYLSEQQEKGITGYTYGMTWSTSVLNLGPKSISIPHDPFMRLPILRCYRDAMKTAETMAAAFVSDETNQNLSNLQKLLLKWHWKLGHLGFQHLQWIGRQGWLGKVGERFGQTAVHPPK